MKTISRYIMTLALLLTAVTGAWAEKTVETTLWEGTYTEDGVEINSTTVSEFNVGDVLRVYVTIPDGGANFKIVYKGAGNDWTETTIPSVGNQWPWLNGGDTYMDVTFTEADITALTGMGIYIYKGEQSTITKVTLITPASSEPAIEVTTNKAEGETTFTEATFAMPAFDATAEYELVRDMQDEANPVAFSGLPSSGKIIVKKGSDGKYQPIEALTIQLIDPLAAAEAQNIIQADGITVKVGEMVPFDIEGSTYYQLDKETLVPLADFLADMKPGLYKMVAEPTDENSPYDGIVYSSQFTAVEQYDLTVKPANDFSKGKVESVTVGSGSVTIDANTGEATKTGIAPDTEVKIKAKRGYVIDKVVVEKNDGSTSLDESTVGMIVCTNGKAYPVNMKDNLPSGVTAVGIVAYKNGKNGLVMALTDEATNMNWDTATGNNGAKAHTPAVEGYSWKVPTIGEWQYNIFTGAGVGNLAGLSTYMTAAGGTGLQNGCYWTSTPKNNSYYARCIQIENGSINFSPGGNTELKSNGYHVRAVFAF